MPSYGFYPAVLKVAVLENEGIRIVAAEFSVGKHERIFYIMGSTKDINAPSMIIRRNSAGSKFMGIANLEAMSLYYVTGTVDTLNPLEGG